MKRLESIWGMPLLILGCSSQHNADAPGVSGGTSGAVSSHSGGSTAKASGGSSTVNGVTSAVAGGGATSTGSDSSSGTGSTAGGTTAGIGTANNGGAAGKQYTLVCPDPLGTNGNGTSGGAALIDTRDGQSYPTIRVGSQTWMASNLNVGQVVPGIPEFPGQSDDTKIEKFCYGDLPENCTRCGGLYTWPEALALPADCATEDCSTQIQSVHRGICPSGWHIPKQSEWTTLAAALATQTGFLTIDPVQYECRPDLGTAMKSTSGWLDNGNGTNATGFNGVAAGWRHDWGGFNGAGSSAFFQSAEMEPTTKEAWGRSLDSSRTTFCVSYRYRDHAGSVRCVED